MSDKNPSPQLHIKLRGSVPVAQSRGVRAFPCAWRWLYLLLFSPQPPGSDRLDLGEPPEILQNV